VTRPGACLVVALVLAPAVAVGDEQEHTHVALPAFKLEGGPGKSTLDVGLDITIGLAALLDLRIAPTFKATASDGLSTILSTDGSSFTAGGSWQLGIAATITSLPDLHGAPSDLASAAQRSAAIVTCRAECDRNAGSPDFCKQLAEARKQYDDKLQEPKKNAAAAAADAAQSAKKLAESKEAKDKEAATKDAAAKAAAARNAATALAAAEREVEASALGYLLDKMEPATLCSAGKQVHVQANHAGRDALLQLPERAWSAGLLIGQTRNKWLDPASGDPMSFRLTTRNSPQVTVAASYVAIEPGSPMTREARVRIDSSWQPQSKTAKWCTPVGTVSRPDGSGSDAAQSCDEQPLGRPTAVRSLRTAAYLGVIDPRDADWRVAFGPTLKYTPVNKADSAYELGAELPIYARISLLKQSLHAVIRLTPAFTFVHASDGSETSRFTITLAVLGDRSLFSNALE